MKLKSCIYVGQVRHRRFAPARHGFSYRLFMMYLDLSELDRVFDGRWLWSATRPALARFRRSDYLGDPGVNLDTAVRDLVEARGVPRPTGPIRLLTHLRYFGYCFNPASFYYCFDAGGRFVEAIVVEVTNTPWAERHAYVLTAEKNGDPVTCRNLALRKGFHVSPFMPMDIDYDWRFSDPGKTLSVHMQNFRRGARVFDATLRLEQRPLGAGAMAGMLARFPLMTARVVAAIYFQALRLWLKRIPLFNHPSDPEAPGAANRP